jgi:hypothetical protein
MPRSLSTLAVAAVLAASLACSNAADLGEDAQDRVKEEVEKAVKKACEVDAKGKAADETEKLCTCAARTLIEEKSVPELMKFADKIDTPAGKKEVARLLKKCM